MYEGGVVAVRDQGDVRHARPRPALPVVTLCARGAAPGLGQGRRLLPVGVLSLFDLVVAEHNEGADHDEEHEADHHKDGGGDLEDGGQLRPQQGGGTGLRGQQRLGIVREF